MRRILLLSVTVLALCAARVEAVSIRDLIELSKAGLGDLQQKFKDWIAGFGRKEKEIVAPLGDVLLINKGGGSIPAPEGDSPDRPAYDVVQQILTEPLRRFAERVDVAQAEGAWAVRYSVDGFPYA